MRTLLDPFVVSIVLDRGGRPSTEFLQPDGAIGPDRAKALRFRLHASPTPVERDRITRLAHEYAGGLREYLDLDNGCEGARRTVLAQVERGLWPKGRPAAEGEAFGEQEEMIKRAWASCNTIEKDGYVTMRGMLDRVLFMATWTTLIVDAPSGWAVLADREGLDEATFYAIWNAWLEASEKTRAGK